MKSSLNDLDFSKGILDIIAGGLVENLWELKVFIAQTLRFFICNLEKCENCDETYAENIKLFAKSLQDDKEPKKPSIELQNLWNFLSMKNRLEYEPGTYNPLCRNCLIQYTKQIIGYLISMKFIVFNVAYLRLISTPIGKGAFAGCISPYMALHVYEELQECRKNGIRLDTDIELIFIATLGNEEPFIPKWEPLIQNFRKLSKAEFSVAKENGITEDLIYQYAYSGVDMNKLLSGDIGRRKEDVEKIGRFYVSMILNDLINEQPLGIFLYAIFI